MAPCGVTGLSFMTCYVKGFDFKNGSAADIGKAMNTIFSSNKAAPFSCLRLSPENNKVHA
ncbi:hypothetical protein PMI29_05793 [Pseudomonas sp. GM49]|nr:hypothetical protein PMI29_05793 [Pseudomonas sp. GM49]